MGEWLGCDYKGLVEPSKNCDVDKAWKIALREGKFDPYMSKSTKLKNPSMRIFHRFITYSLTAKKKKNTQVTRRDMMIMEAAVLKKRINIARLIIKRIKEIQKDSSEIQFGMFITFLSQKLNLELTNKDEGRRIKFGRMHLIDGPTLQKMHMVKSTGPNKWKLVSIKGKENEGEGEKAEKKNSDFLKETVPRKMSRIEIGSSSSNELEKVKEFLYKKFDALERELMGVKKELQKLDWLTNLSHP